MKPRMMIVAALVAVVAGSGALYASGVRLNLTRAGDTSANDPVNSEGAAPTASASVSERDVPQSSEVPAEVPGGGAVGGASEGPEDDMEQNDEESEQEAIDALAASIANFGVSPRLIPPCSQPWPPMPEPSAPELSLRSSRLPASNLQFLVEIGFINPTNEPLSGVMLDVAQIPRSEVPEDSTQSPSRLCLDDIVPLENLWTGQQLQELAPSGTTESSEREAEDGTAKNDNLQEVAPSSSRNGEDLEAADEDETEAVESVPGDTSTPQGLLPDESLNSDGPSILDGDRNPPARVPDLTDEPALPAPEIQGPMSCIIPEQDPWRLRCAAEDLAPGEELEIRLYIRNPIEDTETAVVAQVEWDE